MSKINVEIRNESRDQGVSQSGNGVICIIHQGPGRNATIINGEINWVTAAKSLLLSGMPKGAMIRALLFGAKARIESQEI